MNQPAVPDVLRFRQIHLDFHTSPDIDGIGADFDADEFADTLKGAHVDSVTAFARCHHGHIYYDTKAHPERIHPHLKRPHLLAEQIEACHKRGIRVPIYTTVQWDQYTADAHRDWLMTNESGTLYPTKPLEAGFYRYLDVFHPGYRQFLFDHVRDIFERLPAVDGFFFDICQPRDSLAKHWLDAMTADGLDPADAYERTRFAKKVMDDWKREMTEFVRGFSPDCTIFYNSGHVGPAHRSSAEAYSHFELESLPSGGWGYLHFPLASRYARVLGRQTGRDIMGMTGKFHTSWGDFSSYKNRAALEFECFHMLAQGAKCSIGDQLPPRGRLDGPTYDLIGPVYAAVEGKEPWCRGAESVTELAVLTPEEFASSRSNHAAMSAKQPTVAMGTLRLLQELSIQFDIVDSASDFSPYKVLVLPDEVPVNDALRAKIDRHLAGGGGLIASHRAGLTPEGDRFALDQLGVKLVGDAPYSPDFLVPGEQVGRDLPRSGHVMYLRGLRVEADGADVLAEVEVPYFNRTWRHFCSHLHTPSRGERMYPGVTRKGNAIYFAHPVFNQYHKNAPRWVKRFVGDAIDLLLGGPDRRLVRHDGPSTLLTSLMRQPREGRDVLHLLHYVPERRGDFDVIEDVIPLHDLTLRLRTKAAKARLVPADKPLDARRDGDDLVVTLPRLEGHAMIELT